METTRSKSADFIRIEEKYGAHNYHPLDVVVQRAEGVWVWDVEGNKYLDFLAAYSAVNQGHAHPRIAGVLKEQAGRVTLTSRAFRNDQLGPLYETVNKLTGYARMLPMNSGAEAVETAIKAARKWGYKIKGVPEGKAEILVFTGNFHGRTTTIVGFSDDEQYKDGFGPFTPGFTLLPYGDLDAVRQAMNPNVVGVLVEPIQGESGIIIPPDGYLKGIADLCGEHHALLITDEIQSGLGRTGKMFAFEHEGVRPDIVIIGKALAGGFYPVSGILADDAVMGVFNPGDHGSTFGGNPLATACGAAVMDELTENGVLAHAEQMGKLLGERLEAMATRLGRERVVEARGMGLLRGVELTKPAAEIVAGCRDRGVLVISAGSHVVRLAPPLIISEAEIDRGVQVLESVLGEMPV
jgi:ornithine--oxo-acid transaminase